MNTSKLLEELRGNCPLTVGKICDPGGNITKGEILSRPESIEHDQLGQAFDAIIHNGDFNRIHSEYLEKQLSFAFMILHQTNYETLNINILPTIMQTDQWQKVLDTLRHFPMPGHIVLEFMEQDKNLEIHKSASDLDTLRNLGYRFAIDDLGSGFHDMQHIENVAYIRSLLRFSGASIVKLDFKLASELEANQDEIACQLRLFQRLWEDEMRQNAKSMLETVFEYRRNQQDWCHKAQNIAGTDSVSFQIG